jgi:hypothetical protein
MKLAYFLDIKKALVTTKKLSDSGERVAGYKGPDSGHDKPIYSLASLQYRDDQALLKVVQKVIRDADRLKIILVISPETLSRRNNVDRILAKLDFELKNGWLVRKPKNYSIVSITEFDKTYLRPRRNYDEELEEVLDERKAEYVGINNAYGERIALHTI